MFRFLLCPYNIIDYNTAEYYVVLCYLCYIMYENYVSIIECPT